MRASESTRPQQLRRKHNCGIFVGRDLLVSMNRKEDNIKSASTCQKKAAETDELFAVFLKEKENEASIRRSLVQAGKERDIAFADMKKSQSKHAVSVSKHEKLQAELRQKVLLIKLVHESWKKKYGKDHEKPAISTAFDVGFIVGDDSEDPNGKKCGISALAGGALSCSGTMDANNDIASCSMSNLNDKQKESDGTLCAASSNEQEDVEAMDLLMVESLIETEKMLQKKDLELRNNNINNNSNNTNNNNVVESVTISKATPIVSPERNKRPVQDDMILASLKKNKKRK